MKLLKLKIKNFWSYSSLEFDFDKGLCLISGNNLDEGGSNGSGKSALFNATCFALFGDLPKHVGVDDVINRHVDDGCSVSLQLEEGDISYSITRTRKPNSLNFEINGVKTSDIDVRRTQQLIERTLGFNIDTFLSSVYFAQNSINFLFLNDEHKKSILTELLGLHVFDTARESIVKEVHSNELTISQLETEFRVQQVQVQNSETRRIQLQEKLKFYDEDKQKQLVNISYELDKLAAQIDDAQLKSVQLADSSLKNQLEESIFEQNKMTQLDSIIQIEADIKAKEIELRAWQDKMYLLEHQIKKVQDLTINQCPTCFQQINHTLLATLKNELKTDIELNQATVAPIQAELELFPKAWELEKLRREIALKEQQIKLTKSDLTRQTQLQEQLMVQVMSRRTQLLDQKEREVLEVNPYRQLLDELDMELVKSKSNLDSIDIALKVTRTTYGQLIDLKEVFGNHGVKSYAFDAAVNELNTRVNEYLSSLFEDELRYTLLLETTNTKGATKQILTNQLFMNNEEISVASLSGGEERRLAFAVNIALSDLISARSRRSFNVLFLDECFDGMDTEGKGKCMELLKQLASKRDCVLVIDHNSAFGAIFDSSIKIEKHYGISILI